MSGPPNTCVHSMAAIFFVGQRPNLLSIGFSTSSCTRQAKSTDVIKPIGDSANEDPAQIVVTTQEIQGAPDRSKSQDAGENQHGRSGEYGGDADIQLRRARYRDTEKKLDNDRIAEKLENRRERSKAERHNVKASQRQRPPPIEQDQHRRRIKQHFEAERPCHAQQRLGGGPKKMSTPVKPKPAMLYGSRPTEPVAAKAVCAGRLTLLEL